eukprot:TRINITY_DN30909_c0_g1_i1.p1 TRINITY_DN30909_c0_g1~~TRINITY_DN30909_c0_g1_i1.p1  ORF type:complete len:336 (+),score=128.44 TRINITY_DN30909_c0_g1_i1:49-1008(+)
MEPEAEEEKWWQRAAKEGPRSSRIDLERLGKVCGAMIQRLNAAERSGTLIHLQWSLQRQHGIREERGQRTRLIRLVHTPYHGASVVYVGGGAAKFQKKNKRHPTVDAVESVKFFQHARSNVVQERVDEALKKYKVIIVDNRCREELPIPVRNKVTLEMDCTDSKRWRIHLKWALCSTRVMAGKGQCTMRVGNGKFSVDQLKENVCFALYFMEEHMPQTFMNIREVSLAAHGCQPLSILKRTEEEVAAFRVRALGYTPALQMPEEMQHKQPQLNRKQRRAAAAAAAEEEAKKRPPEEMDVFHAGPQPKRRRRSGLLAQLL